MGPLKAAVIKEIDGIKVVTAIVDPIPDPEATLELARLEIATQGYQDRWDDLIRRGRQIDLENTQEVETLKRDVARYAYDRSNAIKAHARSNPVYFPHVPDEELLSHEQAFEFEKKIKALKQNEYLTVHGEIFEDNRNRKYYHKQKTRWYELQITRITEVKPDGYIWENDLTPLQLAEINAQKENDRIGNLTEIQRQNQAAFEVEAAAKVCADMRSTLEIKGDMDALDKARHQFELLKAEIIKRYKLERRDDAKGPNPTIHRAAD